MTDARKIATKYQLMLDDVAEYCGMLALHAGLARDNAIAYDPVGVKYSLARLAAYFSCAMGIMNDIDKLAAADRVVELEAEKEDDLDDWFR
jgi:hypothetical protein